MVTSKGFTIEQHDVTTIDGYILTNFRSVLSVVGVEWRGIPGYMTRREAPIAVAPSLPAAAQSTPDIHRISLASREAALP